MSSGQVNDQYDSEQLPQSQVAESDPLLAGRSSNPQQAPLGSRKRFLIPFDMAPTSKDKISLLLVGAGLALFLPLTWILVLTGNLKAMGWFAPHPPLQSLAITAFIMGVTPLQPPTPPAPTRAVRLMTHQNILLGVAIPAMALGTASMWWNKHVHNAKHFTTWHAWFGVATVIWVLAQALIGGATVWFGGKAFGGGAKAMAMYKYHRLSGYVLLTLCLATAFLAGGYSDWAVGRGPEFVAVRVVAFYIALPMIWIGLIARTRASKMKFA